MSTAEIESEVDKKDLYYRDASRGMTYFIAMELVVIVGLLIGFIVYMNIYQPKDRFVVDLPDNERALLLALDYPNMTRVSLLAWASQAAAEVMTFGFHDYEDRLMNAKRHFTDEGWESFRQALIMSETIVNLEKFQQIVTAVPRGTPILMQEGIVGEKYQWVVELPLLVTFKVGSKSQPRRSSILLTIQRVPTSESIYGVGIQQWIAN